MSGARESLVEVRGVSKRFGSTVALSGVGLEIRAGEAHALIGENGAGKSTLARIVAGHLRAERGEVLLGGRALAPGSIEYATRNGVRLVHQELAQCPNLSVAENLCLHAMPRGRFGGADFRAMRERAAGLLSRLDPSIDVGAPLESLGAGHRQICQIAAALDDSGGEARLIILDEPTSALSVAETEALIGVVRELVGRGIGVVYVTHRLGEVFACCDRVTVLRDGALVETLRVDGVDEHGLIERMIGRGLPTLRGDAEPAPSGRVVLEARGIRSAGLADVELSVGSGEIVGLAGLVGSGRSRLLGALFGLDRRATGRVLVDGEPMRMRDPRAAIRSGMGLVPEDRQEQGLFFDLGIDENILVPTMPGLSRAGFIGGWRDVGAERALVDQRLKRFRVGAPSPWSRPGDLSGGNQQKLLIARWLSPETRVLLLDEPTRGIDVATKAEIHRLVREAAGRGLGVVLASGELPELLSLSHRVLVMAGGRVVGELRGSEMTEGNVLRLATGTSQRVV